MAIFLTILKIIGIVLLCIIGLILFIILYVLLAPFWFKIQGNIDREMNYNVKIKACTFLHFIQVHVDYFKDEGLNYNVSILGTLVKILPRKPKDEDKKEDEDKKKDEEVITIDETDSQVESEENVSDDTIASEVKEESQTQKDSSTIELDDIQDIDVDSSKIIDTESEEFEEFSEENKKFFVKVRDFFDKYNPVKLINSLKAKIEDIKKDADKIYSVIFDDNNKEWLNKVIKELKNFIKSLKLNMRGTDVDFSTGSPDVTGKVSGALVLFMPIYDKKVRIIPDFTDDDFYIDGDIFIKGRLQLLSVVILVLAIYLDSNTKRILNEIKALKAK